MLRVEGTWHYSRVIHAIFLDAQLIIFVNKQCVCSITKLTTSELVTAYDVIHIIKQLSRHTHTCIKYIEQKQKPYQHQEGSLIKLNYKRIT
jgi:hypothetical protein